MQEYLKRLLQDKARLKKWKKIMLALSCVVVFCTVYALTIPAVTLACNKEEHMHTEECYSQDNELICGKEEHVNRKNVQNKKRRMLRRDVEEDVVEENTTVVKETEPSTNAKSSEVNTTTSEYVLNDHNDNIVSVKVTYKKGDKDVDVTNSGTITEPDDKYLKITVEFERIPSKELRDSHNGSFTYKLPEFLNITTTTKDIVDDSNTKIGKIHVEKGKAIITYDAWYLQDATDGNVLSGNFFVEGEINLNMLNKDNGKKDFNTNKGTITLDYGLEYLEEYGNLEVEKNCEKKADSDYIKYTIQLKAGNGGCQNVYVVDRFTQSKELVEYVGVSKKETTLKSKEDKQNPFETISNNSSNGSVYLTNVDSKQKIPSPITDGTEISKPGTLVWNIDKMQEGEVRTLTYFVKLDDVLLKGITIKNAAQVYTKKDSQIYDKGMREKEFIVKMDYASAMTKVIEKQNGNDNYSKDENGNYLINYRLNFSLGANSNCSIKNFEFRDYLDYGDAYNTDSKMRPYMSYIQNSIVLHVKKANDTAYKDYTSEHLTVGWANGNDDYIEKWTNTEKNPTRFKINKIDGQPITVNPGDSYYVTYTLKVKPEVYAAMQKDSVTINNRFLAYSKDQNIDRVYRQLKLDEYKWVQKTLGEVTKDNQTIRMNDSSKYVKNGNTYESSNETEFKVPAGSYKYVVNVNKTQNQFDVTNVSLKDELSSDVMKFVGYMKVTAHNDETDKDEGTKWVKIDDQTSFNLKLSDIGWEGNNYSYKFEYYATPQDLSDIANVKVTNKFTLKGEVIGDGKFNFENVYSSNEVNLEGSYNLSIQKKAWYYERPEENATSWVNGEHYWVIEIDGSKVRKGTQIKDLTIKDNESQNSYLRKDSLVGVYKGDFSDNYLDEHQNVNDLPKDKKIDLFESSYTDSGYGELVLTAKEDMDLNNEKIFIVVKTEPEKLPSQYRDTYKYKNGVYVKDKNDADYKQVNVATQELHGGADILKELGQTFSKNDGTIKNITPGADSGLIEKICSKLLTENGIYASWAFKVNYAGDLNGKYRVLEEIPDGMELSYIRVKWHGGKTKQIQTSQITGLDGWKELDNVTTNENNESQKTIYYVKGNQALLQLGDFVAGHERDVYSVDVQVVCRVTDSDILLGGQEKSFVNKVTLQSEDGKENLASATSSAMMSNNNLDKASLLDKTEEQKENYSQKVKYTITANELGQNLPSNIQDDNHLMLVDKLGTNLELVADSIEAKDKDGNKVEISTNFDAEKNILEITIPNGKKVIITYTVIVKVAPDTKVDVTNKVYWKNYSDNGGKKDEIRDFSYSINAGGTTTSDKKPEFIIHKYDASDSMKPMNGVEFEIYKCALQDEKIVQETKAYTGTTSDDGTIKLNVTNNNALDFNTVYEVKEKSAPDGYIQDSKPHYIMYANEKAAGYNKDYIQQCQNIGVEVVYKEADFKVQVFNTQRGITVRKAFINNASGKDTKPVSGTYWFGLYEKEDGSTEPLEKVSITYEPNDTEVKSAKFKNHDITKTYYVFELDQDGHPITASQEATVNKLQYTVEYSTNGVTNGGTVTVTNKSRTKLLPSTGSIGILVFRISGATLAFAGMISLSQINKKRKRK